MPVTITLDGRAAVEYLRTKVDDAVQEAYDVVRQHGIGCVSADDAVLVAADAIVRWREAAAEQAAAEQAAAEQAAVAK